MALFMLPAFYFNNNDVITIGIKKGHIKPIRGNQKLLLVLEV